MRVSKMSQAAGAWLTDRSESSGLLGGVPVLTAAMPEPEPEPELTLPSAAWRVSERRAGLSSNRLSCVVVVAVVLAVSMASDVLEYRGKN